MRPGVTCESSKAQKDELILRGINLELVTQSGLTTSLILGSRDRFFSSRTNSPVRAREEERYSKVLGRNLRIARGKGRRGRRINVEKKIEGFWVLVSEIK